jgi:hypothetical protein
MITWFRRLWYLINRPRHERELVREMHDHRQSMHDPSRFGDTHRLIEQSRDAWGWTWLDEAMQDSSVGIRTLRRSPSFAITATLILAFRHRHQRHVAADDAGRAVAAAGDQERGLRGSGSFDRRRTAPPPACRIRSPGS